MRRLQLHHAEVCQYHCRMCGWERPRRKSMVETVAGEMVEVNGKATTTETCLAKRDKESWRQICFYALGKLRQRH